MQLNPQQELAANHKDGPCFATACPGSGKTFSITERTVRLIKAGIPARHILSITFTNKAAEEMKDRIEKALGGQQSGMFIGTFHRLCCQILRQLGGAIGYSSSMTILDENDQVDLMGQIGRQLEHELKKSQIKSIVWQVNDARENLETEQQIRDRIRDIQLPTEIAIEYLARLRKNNQIDFSGMLAETYSLLANNQSILDKLHFRWTHLQVDEFQDTNLAQLKIIELLGKKYNNIFVTGDLDQSIYSFRGARSENIADFIKNSNAKLITLGKNYRSTPQIVSAANKLIKHNRNRVNTYDFTTDNPAGSPVLVKSFQTDLNESEYVAQQIQQLCISGKFLPKDIAVLYRMNSMSRSIEMAMVRHQIPHTVLGSFSFFDRIEIKDSLAMLRLLVNNKDGVAFHRVANRPKRHLGDVTIGRIEKFAHENNVSIFDACRQFDFKNEGTREGIHEILNAFQFDYSQLSISESLAEIHKRMRYEQFLMEDKESCQERKENIDSLFQDMALFGEKGGDIFGYLEQTSLVSSSDKKADGVVLQTLHAAKGLEYPVVFMIGVEQGILPHKMAVDESPDGIDEERRCAFVGMTRSKKILCLSYCQKRQEGYAARQGQVKYRYSRPSQFLEESGLI